MDHETIIRSLALEGYILGELPPAERDVLEEHAADCLICMRELEAADMFAANAAAYFAQAVVENKTAKSHNWLNFLRLPSFPALAFSGALNVALLVFGAYTLVRLPAGPQVARIEEFAVMPPARSEETQICEVGPHQPSVGLRFDLPSHFGRYSYFLDKGSPASGDLDVQPASETLNLNVPVAKLKPGDHKFELYGWEGQKKRIVGSCILRVAPVK